MPAVTIERSIDDAVVTMAWHDIHVVWLKGAATIANQLETEPYAKRLIERWPRGVGMMVVIGAGLPSPPPEVRKALHGVYRRIESGTRGLSYVILGTGFDAVMARGTLMTMNLLTRRPYPASVSNELKKGARWLYYTLGEDPERGTVEQFTQALDAAVRGEAPQTLRTQKR